VSLGASLARAAYSAFLRAAEEIHDKGSFTFAKDIIPYAVFNGIFNR
jgi:hypothetical protein